MADTSVATANTLSKEATLILLSASQPHLAVYLIRGFCGNRAVTTEATIPAHCGLRGTHSQDTATMPLFPERVDRSSRNCGAGSGVRPAYTPAPCRILLLLNEPKQQALRE